MIKLSEAIELGHLVLPVGHHGFYEVGGGKTGGCVFEMACLAVGSKKWSRAPKTWSWLNKKDHIKCPVANCHRTYEDNFWTIIHVFDQHVVWTACYLEPWTFEEMLDWIRSIEPAEKPIRQEKVEKSGQLVLA